MEINQVIELAYESLNGDKDSLGVLNDIFEENGLTRIVNKIPEWTPPPKEQWELDEEKYFKKLTTKQKQKYSKVRKAFFALAEMRIDKYSVKLSKEKNRHFPDNFITLILMSTVAPELDAYYDLSDKKHWDYILETYDNLTNKKEKK